MGLIDRRVWLPALPLRVRARRGCSGGELRAATAQTALYLTGALSEYEDVLSRLGTHQTGKGCLYLTRVDDVDRPALREIIARSYRAARAD